MLQILNKQISEKHILGMSVKNSGVIANGSVEKVKIDNSRRVKISIGAVVVVVAVLAIFLTSHSSINKQIVGVWDTDNGYVMEFMSNGTVRQGDGEEWDMEGTYKITDNILTISDTYGMDNVYFDIKLKGNSMTLSNHDKPENKSVLKKRK